jgi:ABC-2 type transport system permease protein
VYVAGMALHSTLHQGLIMLIEAVVVVFIFKIFFNAGGMFFSLLLLLLMISTLYGLGILVAGLTIGLKQWWVISEAVSTLVTIITPIAYPLAILPLFLQKIALFLPTTYGVMGIRHFLLGEHLTLSIHTIFLRIAIMLIIWIFFGLMIFLIMDRYGRKKGVLSLY